jgi:hypothetical protein
MDVNVNIHDYIEELDSKFTQTKIRYYIKKLHRNKAVGIGWIHAKFWKEFCCINIGIIIKN